VYKVLLDREERKIQMYLAESRLDTSALVSTQSRHTVAAYDEYLPFGKLGHRFSHEFDEAQNEYDSAEHPCGHDRGPQYSKRLFWCTAVMGAHDNVVL